MSVQLSRSPDVAETVASTDDLFPSPNEVAVLTLGALPVGARLIMRCRKDWRGATIAAIGIDAVTLSVCSPTGHTYRVRRPPDTILTLESSIPILGEGCWRAGFARYDKRW